MLAVALLALQSIAARPAKLPVSLGVCELLAKDPTKYNGKEIAVRGLLRTTDEGLWLYGECSSHLVTKHYAWHNILSIYVDPSDESGQRSWQEMFHKLARLHANQQKDRVWVTIIGKLETRTTMDEAVGPGPDRPLPRGFGHLAAAPAEIDVISVKDVTVEHPNRLVHP